MAKYALIQSGIGVDEFRDVDPETVPTHKFAPDGGLLLRPVIENEMPTCRPELSHVITDIVVNQDAVYVTHTLQKFPLEQQQAVVKLEANRRILDRFPQWKQINMIARVAELKDVQSSLTKKEQKEMDEITKAWNWIKSVRDTSNKIEKFDPIPDDYDSNEHWPA